MRDQPQEVDPTILPATPSRRRANTDGPQPAATINPLANNTWSFSNLPPQSPEAPTSEPNREPLLDAHALGNGHAQRNRFEDVYRGRISSPLLEPDTPEMSRTASIISED